MIYEISKSAYEKNFKVRKGLEPINSILLSTLITSSTFAKWERVQNHEVGDIYRLTMSNAERRYFLLEVKGK